MSAHSLTTFINETFGQQFSDLLLAGYRTKPSGRRRRLYLTELEAGAEADWVVELVASRPLGGDEPLVLAALLKLLLSRPNLSNRLKFEMGEVLAEIQWPDDPDTLRQVKEVIVGYTCLLYDKRVDTRAARRASATSEGGCYHLLTGYVRDGDFIARGALDKTGGSVYFDDGFILGLREGRVFFAGIDFGSLSSNP